MESLLFVGSKNYSKFAKLRESLVEFDNERVRVEVKVVEIFKALYNRAVNFYQVHRAKIPKKKRC